MTFEELKQLADSFFEWPTKDRTQVTLTSALLFAQHVLERRGVCEISNRICRDIPEKFHIELVLESGAQRFWKRNSAGSSSGIYFG